MKRQYFAITLCALILISVIGSIFHPVYSQAGINAECGDILENVYRSNWEEHVYLLEMKEEESFTASVVGIGSQLRTGIIILGPTDIQIGRSRGHDATPSVSSGILSADGTYKISVYNHPPFSASTGGPGRYKLNIGCETRNGIINPGDIPTATPTSAPVPTATTRPLIPTDAPECTGACFPGLAPIDLSTIISTSMIMEVPVVSVIPIGNEIVGFTFDAAEGDSVSLAYTKLSGTMEAGLVVLSEENDIVFFTNLIASQSLSTTLVMPSTGSYTIAAFRVNLTNQENPVPVMFNLEASIESVAGE